MKIRYNRKTDYLEVFFRVENSYYESSSLSNDVLTVFCGEESKDVIGYGIDDAFVNLSKSNKFTHKQKLALYSWIIRKKKKLTQEEFAEHLSSKYNDNEGMSIRTIQRIEDCETNAPYYYPIELKKIDPDFDLNYIA